MARLGWEKGTTEKDPRKGSAQGWAWAMTTAKEMQIRSGAGLATVSWWHYLECLMGMK